MRRLLISAVLVVATGIATGATALAQDYRYPPRGGYYPPPPGDYYGDRGGWGGGRGWGGGGYYQRPVYLGNVCATSRGSCPTRPRPIESSCSCFIPGFGPKRGGVVGGGGW
jgi:hypothetical protein